MFNPDLVKSAESFFDACRKKGLKLATAESCTGGMLSALITELSGVSVIFVAGYVTYSNESKTKMLGVDESLIRQHGAVSEEVALAMARGARQKSGADLAVSITGVAGPTGGTERKPVGTVYIGIAAGDELRAEHFLFKGDRAAVREQSVNKALEMLTDALRLSFVSVA